MEELKERGKWTLFSGLKFGQSAWGSLAAFDPLIGVCYDAIGTIFRSESGSGFKDQYAFDCASATLT